MRPDPDSNRPCADTGDRLTHATRRVHAAGQFLRAMTSLLYRGGVLVLLLAAGFLLVGRAGRLLGPATPPPAPEPAVGTVAPPIDWSRVDAAVVRAATDAREHAERQAAKQLDAWTAELLERIDADFLPWYFGYWNQQTIGLKACWQGVKYSLAGYVTDSATPSPADQMVQDIQAAFANRVLRPENARLRMEQITRQAVEAYLADLRDNLHDIQARYSIPPRQWDRYLEGIGTSIQRVDGDRQVPLSLKAVAAGTGAAAAIVVRSLARLASRLEVRFAAEAVERPLVRMAAGAGSRLGARMGGRMLGPAVAVAVIAWDLWDHRQTVRENQPLLRDALTEYLSLQRQILLHDPQTGVLASIREIEGQIARSLARDTPALAAADHGAP